MSLLGKGLKSVDDGTSKAKSVGEELVDSGGANGMSTLTGTVVGGITAGHVRVLSALLLVAKAGPVGGCEMSMRQKEEGSAGSRPGVKTESFENREVDEDMKAVSAAAEDVLPGH